MITQYADVDSMTGKKLLRGVFVISDYNSHLRNFLAFASYFIGKQKILFRFFFLINLLFKTKEDNLRFPYRVSGIVRREKCE